MASADSQWDSQASCIVNTRGRAPSRSCWMLLRSPHPRSSVSQLFSSCASISCVHPTCQPLALTCVTMQPLCAFGMLLHWFVQFCRDGIVKAEKGAVMIARGLRMAVNQLCEPARHGAGRLHRARMALQQMGIYQACAMQPIT